MIAVRLFGLQFVGEEPLKNEVWDKSVWKFVIYDETDAAKANPLGVLYVDPFMRPGKTVGSAQFTLRCSKELDNGERQVPATALVMSLPPGQVEMTFSMAQTFLHEIGHVFHSLLSKTKLQHLSGTRGEVDFVEFPSLLFENFVTDPQYLCEYAKDQDGNMISKEFATATTKNAELFCHMEVAQQLLHAIVDQSANSCTSHSQQGVRDTISQTFDRFLALEASKKAGLDRKSLELCSPPVLSSFDHLLHYGGTYYCYVSCKALASHVWDRSLGRKMWDREFGKRLQKFFGRGSSDQSLAAILDLVNEGVSARHVPLQALVTAMTESLANIPTPRQISSKL
eukprot:gene1217-944_t